MIIHNINNSRNGIKLKDDNPQNSIKLNDNS